MTTALLAGIWVLVAFVFVVVAFHLGVRASDAFHSEHVFKKLREAGLYLGHDSIRIDNRKTFQGHPEFAAFIALTVQIALNSAQNKALAKDMMEAQVKELRRGLVDSQ